MSPQSTPIDWPRLVEIIEAHDRFLLTTHVRPDCDAVGSTLALALMLEDLGKSATVVFGYDIPPNLEWLDPDKRIVHLAEISQDELDAAEVFIVIDTSAWAQLSHIDTLLRDTRAKKVVIDHHVSSDDLGAEVFKDSKAEAAGRLIYQLALHLEIDISADIATLLFAALATDTGWFHFASVDSATFRLGAELVALGASPEHIYRNLYERETLARLQLIGRVMARTQTDLDGRLIYTWIRLEDFQQTGALPSDSEDVINLTLSVEGTRAAVIFVEQADGRYKISFRSRCRMDCAEVAERFGGGGHKAAAGATVHESLETVLQSVLDVVRRAMG